ncbi:tetratricopeptide repeat protein [Candidatus Uhrbacteria bacterium]|nr:tetratricopeptide repeat protein [Candidatus Uhrbacteria bacterium]
MFVVIGAILLGIGVLLVGSAVIPALPRSARLVEVPAPAAQRELALKERLVLERMMRRFHGLLGGVERAFRARAMTWGMGLRKGYRRLRLLAQEYTERPSVAAEPATCDALIAAARTAFDAEAYEEAEERLLACLKIDAKHRDAYFELAVLYRKRKEEALAEETLRFLRRLCPEDAEVAAELADTLQERGKPDAAIKEIQAAIALVPRNPRYLDFAVELAILKRNPRLAQKWVDQLREANSENQKLEAFEERIRALDSSGRPEAKRSPSDGV